MPNNVASGPRRMRELASIKSILFLLFILLLGALGTLLTALGGGPFGLGFFLSAFLFLVYLIVIILPVLWQTIPTPFPVRNGTGRRVRKFKVAAKCRDGREKDIAARDFANPPYSPERCLMPGDEAPLKLDLGECIPTEVTIQVTVLDEEGNEQTFASDPIGLEYGTGEGGECQIILVEHIEIENNRPVAKLYAHLICTGEPPVDVHIELKPV